MYINIKKINNTGFSCEIAEAEWRPEVVEAWWVYVQYS